MWDADRPVAVKRAYSTTGATTPADYFGISCVHRSTVVHLTWSSVISTLGTSYVMPAGAICDNLADMSPFLYPVVPINTTVVKSHGWTLFDYTLDDALPIVVVLDVAAPISVLVAGGFAYSPVTRPSALFHVLYGKTRRAVFRIPTPVNEDIDVTLKAGVCSMCQYLCVPAADYIGRLNASGNASILYAAAPTDEVTVVPVQSSLSCGGEGPATGLTPPYIKDLATLLCSEYQETMPVNAPWESFAGEISPQRRVLLSLVSQQGGTIPMSYIIPSTMTIRPGAYAPAPIGLFFADNTTKQYTVVETGICNHQPNIIAQGCIRVLDKTTGADVFQYGDAHLPVFGPFRKGQFPYDVQVRSGTTDRLLMLSVLVEATTRMCTSGVVVFDSYCRSGVSCADGTTYSCMALNSKPAGYRVNFGPQPANPPTRKIAAAEVRVTMHSDAILPVCDITSTPKNMVVQANASIDLGAVAVEMACAREGVLSIQTPGAEPISGLALSVGCKDWYDISARRCVVMSFSLVFFFFFFFKWFVFLKNIQECGNISVPVYGMRELLQGMSGITLGDIVATLSSSGSARLNASTMPLYAYADAIAETHLRRRIPDEIGGVPRFSPNDAPLPLYSAANLTAIYPKYGGCSSASECYRAYSCNWNEDDWNGPHDIGMCGSWSVLFTPGTNPDVHWMSFGSTSLAYDYGVILSALSYTVDGQSADLQPVCIGGNTAAALTMGIFSGEECHYPAVDFIRDNLGVCGDRYLFGEMDVTFSDQKQTTMSLCGGPPAVPPPTGCYGLSGQGGSHVPCQFIPGHIPFTSMIYGSREIFGAYTNIKYPYLSIVAMTTLAFIETSNRFQALLASVGWPGPPGTPRESWDVSVFDSTIKCAQLSTLTPEPYGFLIVDGEEQFPYGGGPWNLLCHLVRMHSVFACQVGRATNRNHCIPIRATQFLPQVYSHCWQDENISAPIEFFSQPFVLGVPDPSRPSGVQCNRLPGFSPFMPTGKVSDLSNLALLYLWTTWNEQDAEYDDTVGTIFDRIGVFLAATIRSFDEGQLAMEEVELPPAPAVIKCDRSAGDAVFVTSSDTLKIYC